jgi:Protein of unknown function (DUF4065)
LSEAEEEAIDEAFAKFGHLSQWQLVDLVHQFPEWQDPEGSRIRIEYEDILKAGNKTPEEIQAIEGEIDALSRQRHSPHERANSSAFRTIRAARNCWRVFATDSSNRS